eukprot:3636823-Pyramimonas_sp.AAC.1
MRRSARWPSHRRAYMFALDRLLRAEDGPRSHDLVPDRLRGATVSFPCVRRAGNRVLIARPKRRT